MQFGFWGLLGLGYRALAFELGGRIWRRASVIGLVAAHLNNECSRRWFINVSSSLNPRP